MFDVIWTDPNVERMGQRMLRKEQEAKEKEKRRAESIRQSVSTSSSSATSDRGFSLFSGKSKKKGSTTSDGKANPYAASCEESECGTTKANRNSQYGVKAAVANDDVLEAVSKTSDGAVAPLQSPTEIGATCSPVPRDSALSKWAHQAAVATGVFEKIVAKEAEPKVITENYVQRLGPSSFVTRTIETTFSKRTEEDIDQIDEMLTETHISSDGVKIQTPPLADVPEESTPQACEESGSFPPPYNFPHTPPPTDNHTSRAVSSPTCRGRRRLGDSEAWKPPHEWDCTPTKKSNADTISECSQTTLVTKNANNSAIPTLPVVQRELRMMAAASSELMLANLKSSMGEAADATVYKEFEMTKKRWMFSALHRQDGYAQLMDRPNERPESATVPKRNRILALYETPTSASFLAALYPAASITHLSPQPLSPHSFPNIHPLLVPTISVSASSRALPPQLYSAVTCLAMPALLPSTDIPPLLRHINRCLAPGGALHLTIIDPQPVSSSMGPKLRQWLFTNLLINLEQAFRTTWPSETFPAWLAVGRLRGKGSTIATKTIQAVPIIPKNPSKEDLKVELRCLSNRMLWQEIWGGFVQASHWWWEDQEIVEECVSLGTYWQCSHIVAVKEDPIKSSRSVH
ncbi:hypothetical protein F5B22DRAFT_607190 [Xylaria bambusicola]|uniref:uncharacterized protein n=1 Tax=Xylaria bambusicola TaxID=326684 RepID=UPI002008B876|nr:uncharacterized protein F5B22DRAFT_607190 [Xylaria bambusicola]KAI0515394.1 hypothetical protein F5B22DRAFT_607190 [Xylaria bambusicola]